MDELNSQNVILLNYTVSLTIDLPPEAHYTERFMLVFYVPVVCKSVSLLVLLSSVLLLGAYVCGNTNMPPRRSPPRSNVTTLDLNYKMVTSATCFIRSFLRWLKHAKWRPQYLAILKQQRIVVDRLLEKRRFECLRWKILSSEGWQLDNGSKLLT